MLELLGLLSGICAVLQFIPYIRDIFKRKTKPQRTTFFIWSTLGTIAFFSQLAKGATNSLWLPGGETLFIIFTFFLSIKYGVGGFNKKDYIALGVAVIGLLLWYVTKEAAIALYIVIIIDAVGSYLTIHKTYYAPEIETRISWILATLAGVFATLAVGKLDFILLSYPLYILVANAAVVAAIELGKRHKARK